MPIVDLVLPKMGESIVEATVLKWLKNVGDTIKADEMILEIATDKVDSEVPSIVDGTVTELLYQVNDVVPIGAVIARIQTAGADDTTPVAAPAAVTTATPAAAPAQKPASTAGAKFYSPLVLNIAANEGIALSELENLDGTGADGRVTKNDVLKYLENRKQGAAPAAKAVAVAETTPAVVATVKVQPPPAVAAPVTYNHGNNIEIIEMDRMRKLIADHMVRSKHTSPHVTSFVEADVTNMVQWRERVKKEFEKRENTKITFTPLFIEAVAKCIKKFPLINSSLEGTNILVKKDINIGMATALPSGNLIVPVIKNADQLNIVGITKQVNQLAHAAREGKLKADDTQGGTFTITNLGSFNNLTGTPIINQPQVAILAVGAIKKRPVVIETPQGDSIAIRHMMYLSMSYDHRIVDGSLGATFLAAVASELENFEGVEF